MIVGVAGRNGAGKGAVVAFLTDRGFVAHSLSDELREELAARGLQESREVMIELGRELRELEGPGVLAGRVARRVSGERNHVVDSIRHPAEVSLLKHAFPRFFLLWVDASEATRFARQQARGRPGDPRTLEEFRRFDIREFESNEASGQQLGAVHAMADVELENNGPLDLLHSELAELLAERSGFDRPGWDEYFMSIARVVATRSNCVKRKVAAVITQDRRIIATGYNGTPRGVANCNEGGCPRCNSFGPEGTDLGECVCSHGEENAITQSAYHGVSVKGGTLYTTFCPCLLCTKMIINAGLAEVVYDASYPLGERSLALLDEAGVRVRQVEQR